jgi:hypothetical protein
MGFPISTDIFGQLKWLVKQVKLLQFKIANGGAGGGPTGTGSANEITYWTGTNTLSSLTTSTYPSLTELALVKGVTSAIQTQIDSKAVDANVVHITGVETITGAKTFSPTVTASGSAAKATVISPTLTASANGDQLVALDIAPTFVPGSFTGTNQLSLRMLSGSKIGVISATTYSMYFAANEVAINAPNSAGNINFQINDGQKARITSNGNFLINNTTDNSAKLQLTNGTTNGGGQIGSELLTTGTGGTWTGGPFSTTGYTHNGAGDAVALTGALTGGTTSGNFYQVTYTITGTTVSTVAIAIGGVVIASAAGNTATTTIGIKAISSAALTLTPTLATFNGTVVVSVKQITAGIALQTYANSAGTVTNEVRASMSTTNTFVGLNAGQVNLGTLGLNNTFYGSNAGLSNTSGTNNTFIGNLAGNTNSTGGGNTIVGSSAGGSSNGANITLLGFEAGKNSTSANGNVFIGTQAGRDTTTGGTNTFIGFNAGLTSTTSTGQIVIGSSAVALGTNTTVIGTATTTYAAIFGNLLLGSTTDSGVSGEKLQVTGDLVLRVAGNKIKIATGSNASAGTVTLSGATTTVSTTAVTANSIILLTTQSVGGTAGYLVVSAKSAGVSFTITSSMGGTDTSVVGWVIIN